MKDFWKTKHDENNNLWLTGCTLIEYKKYHNIDIDNKVVLEIGIGKGIATREMSELVQKLYTIDIVQEALDKVSDISETFLTEQFIEIPPDTFDFIICNLVLQHCDSEACNFLISNAIRTLKPTGMLSIQTADGANLSAQYKDFQKNKQLYMRNPNTVKQWIIDAGGTVGENRTYNFHSANIHWNIMEVVKDTYEA